MKVNFHFPTFSPVFLWQTSPIGRQTLMQASSFPTPRVCFEEACKELNIELYVLPPYSPKYNGRIERSNRTIREEFYYKNKSLEYCYRLGEINEQLQDYIYKYNNYRPHQALENESYMSDNGMLAFQLDDLRAKFAVGL